MQEIQENTGLIPGSEYKNPHVYDSIYVKCPEQVDTEEQKADWQFLGARRGEYGATV